MGPLIERLDPQVSGTSNRKIRPSFPPGSRCWFLGELDLHCSTSLSRNSPKTDHWLRPYDLWNILPLVSWMESAMGSLPCSTDPIRYFPRVWP